jgi:hypothetical protein
MPARRSATRSRSLALSPASGARVLAHQHDRLAVRARRNGTGTVAFSPARAIPITNAVEPAPPSPVTRASRPPRRPGRQPAGSERGERYLPTCPAPGDGQPRHSCRSRRWRCSRPAFSSLGPIECRRRRRPARNRRCRPSARLPRRDPRHDRRQRAVRPSPRQRAPPPGASWPTTYSSFTAADRCARWRTARPSCDASCDGTGHARHPPNRLTRPRSATFTSRRTAPAARVR